MEHVQGGHGDLLFTYAKFKLNAWQCMEDRLYHGMYRETLRNFLRNEKWIGRTKHGFYDEIHEQIWMRIKNLGNTTNIQSTNGVKCDLMKKMELLVNEKYG